MNAAPPISLDAQRERRRQAIAARYASEAQRRLDAINALIAAAVAAGTHSAEFKQLCGECRNWCDEIWFVVPGTRKQLCAACADEMGQGPRALAERRRP